MLSIQGYCKNSLIILFPSLLPYSEPDQDISPNNDPDWDWGAAAAGASKQENDAVECGDNKENNDKKVGLTEAVLTDATNVISKSNFFRRDIKQYKIIAGDVDIRIAGRFKLGKKLGSGSFGEIYLATDLSSNEDVAVKLEHKKTKHPQLHIECRFYKVRKQWLQLFTKQIILL